MIVLTYNIGIRIYYYMDEQVLKTIRSSMCPKDKWVPDKDVTNCFKCDSKFNKLYRWKHHCRLCGRIFCSPCCEFYLNGLDLGEEDKPMRTCEFCNRKFWTYIIEKDPNYYHKLKGMLNIASLDNQIPDANVLGKSSPKSQQQKRTNKTQTEKMVEIKALVADFQIQVDPMPLSKLWSTAESKLSVIIQIILKMNKIPFTFYDWLQKIAKRVVIDIPANAMVTRNMDICKNIKLKCEKQEEVGARYVVGTMLKKSNISKRMPKNFEEVNILLLYGNIEAADLVGVRANSFISFEEMIENRKKQTAKLIDKLKAMQVGIVFLEGSIDKEAQDLLFSSDIAVISKVDIRTLTRLRVSLEIGKIVEKLGSINPLQKGQCVGKSKHVYFTKIKNFENEQQTVMIVQGNKPQNGMTIIIGGPDKQVLKYVKYQFKQLLRIARHLVLKIYKLLLDQDMMMSMNSQIKSRLANSNEPNMFFSSNLESQGTVVAYLRHRYLVYKRIVFVESDYSPINFPEVNKQMIDDYLRKKEKNFKSRWAGLTEICQIADESRRVYSTDDLPLGEYILKKLLSINKKCEACRKPFYQHIEVFYWQHLYAKVEVQSRIVDKKCVDEENNEFGCEEMFEELSKIKDKQKIQCYIECDECKMPLTDKINLRQQHLELSYVAFIGHIFHSTHITHLRYSPDPPKANTCQHNKKSRIFQLGSFFVRIYTGFLVLSQEFKLGPEQIISHAQSKQLKIQNELSAVFSVNIEQIINYTKQQIHKIANTSKNPNMSLIIKNPKESFIKAASLYRSLGKETQLTRVQYMDILIPEMMDYLGRISHLSMILLSSKQNKGFLQLWKHYASIAHLLNRILKILGLFNKSSRHQNHRIHKQSFQTCLMEEYDINTEFLSQKTIETDSSPSPEAKQIESPTSDFCAANIKRRPSNFPSLVSTKVRQTMSTFVQSKVTRELIDSIFKDNLNNFNYDSVYINNFPCNSTCQSLISNALNSGMHKDALRKQLIEVTVKLTKCEFQVISNNEEINKISSILDAHQKGLEAPPLVRKRHSPDPYYDVCISYPKQFQAIRSLKGITTQNFITAIVGTDVACSAERPGNYCLKSFNDVFCMRFVSEKEYQSILKFLPKYFEHMREPSMLIPIFGVYEVIKNSKSDYVVIMENIFFGMDQWIVYDLKGTRCRRFSKTPNAPLDINYLADRNSEPLFSSTDVLQHLKRTVDFLAECGLADYSVSLVVNVDPREEYLDGSRIKLGIVNYIKDYGLSADKFSKSVISLSNTSTNDAGAYADKLYRSVRRYFWAIPT